MSDPSQLNIPAVLVSTSHFPPQARPQAGFSFAPFVYEYFITDKVGHAQDMEAAKAVLKNLAGVIRGVLTRVDLNRTSVILTSDHGNIEDLSSRNHTLNQVPTIVWGANRERIADRIKTLADITPAIVQTLTEKAAHT